MKLIVGLGNPGTQYAKTRHNVGFMCVEYIAAKLVALNNTTNSEFMMQKSFDSFVFEIRTNHAKILMAKPATFMNRSGTAVKKIRDFYKIELRDIIVIHDDLDIALGQFKIQLARGPKVHNGISSTEQALGSNEFLRVRVGVENRSKEFKMSGEAYVLQNFSSEETTTIQQTFSEITDRLLKEHLRQ